MLPHGDKEDFTHCDMEILIIADEVEVMVEEEEEVGYMKTSPKEIQVEDEEDLVFVEMEEVKTCSREPIQIIDKTEIG